MTIGDNPSLPNKLPIGRISSTEQSVQRVISATDPRKMMTAEQLGDAIEQARDEYQLGNYSKAKEDLGKILEKMPPEPSNIRLGLQHASGWTLLGRIYLALKEDDLAEKALSKAVELFRIYIKEPYAVSQNYLDYGFALTSTGRHNDAVEELRKAINLGYDEHEIHLCIGLTL